LVSSFRLVGRSGAIQRVVPRALISRVVTPITVRRYASKKNTIDAVVSEKQKKNEFVRMLEEEVSVLKNSLEEAESSNVSTEATERFLKETGFKLVEEKEEGLVKLSRTQGDKTIEVSFSDAPEDFESEEGQEDNETTEEGETEGEEKEEAVDQESEGTGEDREHAFTVEIKSAREGKDSKPFLFQCFAKTDGSFIVNKMTYSDHIPVQISYWSEDLQRELISFLDPLGINERLSYFIHQFLNRKETEENISVLEKFKDFVTGK